MFDDEGPLFAEEENSQIIPTTPQEVQLPPEELLTLDFIPAFSVLPVMQEEQLVYIHVLLRTAAHSRETSRTPLNVCLVLDQSSSMRGDKLYAVKTAARHVVDQLTVNDYFSLISFNDRPTTVVRCQKVTSRETIKQQVDSIEGKGGTELANGLFAGISEMRPATAMTSLNYILLLTDGQTYGDADRCVQLGEEAARHKIVIHPMGVGTDWNEDLLETVAAKTGGSSEYIESADQIVKIFLQKINQLRGTLTQNSSLRYEGLDNGRLKKVYRVTPNISELPTVATPDGATEVSLGPLGQGTEYSLLLEVIVPPRNPGMQRIGNVSIVFAEPGTSGASKAIELPVGLNFAESTRGATIDPEVKGIIEKVTAYTLQSRAWQEIASGDIAGGTRRLAAVSTRLLSMGQVDLAQEVQQEVQNLKQRGTATSQGKKRIKYGTRDLTADMFNG
jgi:Ca-activated chloride channel homolog